MSIEFEDIIAKRKRFNRKPFAHWQAAADRLVIQCLLDAANVDERSLIGYLARKRILEIARQENAELLEQELTLRGRMAENFARIMASMGRRPLFRNALKAAGIQRDAP